MLTAQNMKKDKDKEEVIVLFLYFIFIPDYIFANIKNDRYWPL